MESTLWKTNVGADWNTEQCWQTDVVNADTTVATKQKHIDN